MKMNYGTLAAGLLAALAVTLAPPASSQAQATGLGTLGGSYSYAYSINNAGEVVGQASTADGSWKPFLWSEGTMSALPTGGGDGVAYAVNNAGDAVGRIGNQAALWRDGALTLLPVPDGASSTAYGISDSGAIVGEVNGSAAVWQNGTLSALPSPYGAWSAAYGVNSAGQIVGHSSGHAVLWDNGDVTELGSLGGPFGYAYGINENGQVCGISFTADWQLRAFRWADGVMTDLGTLGGSPSSSVMWGINDKGQVAGSSNNQVFIWSNGRLSPVAGPTGSVFSAAYDLNNDGLAVGFSYNSSGFPQAALFVTASDVTPPVTAAALSAAPNAAGWYNGPVSVTLSAQDDDSGVAATYYSLDGASAARATTPVSVSGDGVHSLSFWSVDVAGNVETAKTETIRIDATLPTATAGADQARIFPPNGALVPVTISGRLTDALSGLDRSSAVFSVVDEYGDPQPAGAVAVAADGSYSFTLELEARRLGSDKNGRSYTITVRGRDLAGNTGSATTTVLVVHDQRG